MTKLTETQSQGPEIKPYSPKDILVQVQLIQKVMSAVMKEGEHYGTIPGTNKPSLWKPGAEKLCFTFRLVPEFEVLPQSTIDEEHVKYVIRCRLVHMPTGMVNGTGIGSCSSREKKYKLRSVAEKKATAEEIAMSLRKETRSGNYGAYAVYVIPNDPNDVENTILKMAQKRALVAATLVATAASDIFTQDLEEEDVGADSKPKGRQPRQKEKKSAGSKNSSDSKGKNEAMMRIRKLINELVEDPETGAWFEKLSECQTVADIDAVEKELNDYTPAGKGDLI